MDKASSTIAAIAALAALGAACSQSVVETEKSDTPARAIIDAHLHSSFVGGDDAADLEKVLAAMDANGISRAVMMINEARDIGQWGAAAPGRFLLGPAFPCVALREDGVLSCAWDGEAWPDIDWLRAQYESGVFQVMGEMLFVYAGVAPGDPRMDPYWALAAELGVPVGVHINRGPPKGTPSRPEGCCPDFNADLGDPSLLRPVLLKYPGLKIWLQHAGFPATPEFDNIDYLEETFALLEEFPEVYADMTALHSLAPPPVHEAAVKAFLDRGFIDRVMFGSDNWDAAAIVERYEAMDFLTEDQKRGVFHDNAARFFGLAGE